jgi:site-specific recombinase XerD
MTNQSRVIGALVRLIKQHQLSYREFIDVCKLARKEIGLVRQKEGRKLPKILSDKELQQFFEGVDKVGNLKHQIMLRLLLFTAVRVAELANIEIGDVDFGANKIFIAEGKGKKDRYILFPESFKLALKSHMEAHRNSVYLFESNYRRQYSTRQIQRIVKSYSDSSGMGLHIHPHLFRHQMLTYLTRQGLTDAQIQLISGHASKKSLEIYQHIGLDSVKEDYQKAVRGLEI